MQLKRDDLGSSLPLRVHAIFWNTMGPGSVAYTLRELFDNLDPNEVERRIWCLNTDERFARAYQRRAFPRTLYRAFCKAGISAPVQGNIARLVPLRSIRSGDIVYVWPPFDLRMIGRAQDRGAIVIAERINCMGAMSRDLVSRAFARRGLPLPAGTYLLEHVTEEREQMLQCDFVTAPNSFVEQSLRDSGIAEHRILPTSYGYNPKRLGSAIGAERPERAAVFAFVGLGIVRKGLDVLLEAWERARPNARLLIAGVIDDEIRTSYASTLGRAEVRELGYVTDIASVYAAADVFVFPTHEEGGPQVVYEAAACGLPSIVSPMGAGRVVRHGVEGLVVNPLDVSEVADALTRLADDSDLRRDFGRNAADRARMFEWRHVGRRLYEEFRRVAADV